MEENRGHLARPRVRPVACRQGNRWCKPDDVDEEKVNWTPSLVTMGWPDDPQLLLRKLGHVARGGTATEHSAGMDNWGKNIKTNTVHTAQHTAHGMGWTCCCRWGSGGEQ